MEKDKNSLNTNTYTVKKISKSNIDSNIIKVKDDSIPFVKTRPDNNIEQEYLREIEFKKNNENDDYERLKQSYSNRNTRERNYTYTRPENMRSENTKYRNRNTQQYRTPNYKKNESPNRKTSIQERLVMQFTICGIIMCSIFALKFVDSNSTNKIQENLKSELSKDISQEITSESLDNAVTTFKDMSNSVKDVFGHSDSEETEVSTDEIEDDIDIIEVIESEEDPNSPEVEIIEENQESEVQPNNNSVSVEENGEITIYKNNKIEDIEPEKNIVDFRIDEDILKELNSKEDIYNNEKKSIAP